MAMPRSPMKYCHIADPKKCWAVTGRRTFLDVNLAAPEFGCAWLSLLQQCDHKLLIGGMGIQECGRCTHKEVGPASSDPRMDLAQTALPKMFAHGQTLGITCWEE